MCVGVIALTRSPIRAPDTPLLDAAQQGVVDHDEGPLLVLAGPGTGKTTTIVEAIIARIHGSARPLVRAEQILVLTFGRKAADELRDRVAARLDGALMPVVATFHSFCYALLCEFADADEFAPGPRLLSGPEQEQRVRELLTHAIKDGRLAWPQDLDPAVGTRGLAKEVRALIAKTQSLGLDSEELAQAGRVGDIPAWSAVAQFLTEYLDVLDAEGVIDYSELVQRAVLLAQSPASGGKLRERYLAVFVDEYQDTDPAQVRLLQAITTPATSLVAVGDPDQAIYGFRGADVGGILRFSEDFRTLTGAPAPVSVLNVTRRFGPAIRDAAGRVIRRVPMTGISAAVQRAHRSPVCQGLSDSDSEVEVITFDSALAQAAAVADSIRRSRLQGEVQRWSQVAVLVRSTARDIPILQQALISAGVPVEVLAEDIPLRSQAGVGPLLDVLRTAVNIELLTVQRAERLLSSPLIRMRPTTLRRLGRSLRALDRDQGQSLKSSAELIRDCIVDPRLLIEVPQELSAPVRALAAMIEQAGEQIASGGSVAQILWGIWDATGWPARLQRAALGGGAVGRAADRDLDAVVALFAVASRVDLAFDGRRGVVNFIDELDNQAVAEASFVRASARDAVALLTSHRSKGLQWPHVYVVGAQEGTWPDLRVRGSLLSESRLGRDGLNPKMAFSDALAEERRLFFVACTRAQRRLVVTAVKSGQDSGDQPSRFLDDLSEVSAVVRRHEGGFRSSPLAVVALVAELRSVAQDPQASPAVRNGAASRLALLAANEVAVADPANWWGTREWTDCAQPVRDRTAPVRMSGSSWTNLDRCSLSWFLEHEVNGQSVRGPATAFGSVVHALADAVARGELPAQQELLTARASQVWKGLAYEADWQASAELAQASAALARFVNWHESRPNRKLVASEAPFEVEFEVPGDRVKVRGSADRVELDEHRELHVVDLKTEKKAKSAKELAEHRQLALYQVVASEGAFDSVLESDPQGAREPRPAVAGAELIQLRIAAGSDEFPKVQQQAAVDPHEIRASLAQAVDVIRSEGFVPVPTANNCRFCDFARVCPAQRDSREVVR